MRSLATSADRSARRGGPARRIALAVVLLLAPVSAADETPVPSDVPGADPVPSRALPSNGAYGRPRTVWRTVTKAGHARLLYRPEFRAARLLRDELRSVGIEGLGVELVGPRVARLPERPGARPPPPELSRLALVGADAIVDRGLRHLLRMDRAPRGVSLSILVSEVRSQRLMARGNSFLYDKAGAPNPKETVFRGIESSFDPDAYLASSLSGMRPFEGTSIRLADPNTLGGAWEATLRMLLKQGHAEFLAWPCLRLTEGEPGRLESLEQLEVLQLHGATTAANPRVTKLAETVGLRLMATPVRVGVEEATLDIDLWFRLPELLENPDAFVGSVGLRQREVKTRVTVRDDTPLLLGGLFLRRRLATTKSIPGISRIKPLDAATNAADRRCVDTEMLLLVRARILDPAEDAARAAK